MPIPSELRQRGRRRVLLVSDRPPFAEVAAGRAEWNGFEVVVAHSDYEATAQLVQFQPHAVVIDMATAEDPLRLCRWVNRSSRDIALVVTGDRDSKAAAQSAGADIYVTSDDLETLEGRLKDLLESSSETERHGGTG